MLGIDSSYTQAKTSFIFAGMHSYKRTDPGPSWLRYLVGPYSVRYIAMRALGRCDLVSGMLRICLCVTEFCLYVLLSVSYLLIVVFLHLFILACELDEDMFNMSILRNY